MLWYRKKRLEARHCTNVCRGSWTAWITLVLFFYEIPAPVACLAQKKLYHHHPPRRRDESQKKYMLENQGGGGVVRTSKTSKSRQGGVVGAQAFTSEENIKAQPNVDTAVSSHKAPTVVRRSERPIVWRDTELLEHNTVEANIIGEEEKKDIDELASEVDMQNVTEFIEKGETIVEGPHVVQVSKEEAAGWFPHQAYHESMNSGQKYTPGKSCDSFSGISTIYPNYKYRVRFPLLCLPKLIWKGACPGAFFQFWQYTASTHF